MNISDQEVRLLAGGHEGSKQQSQEAAASVESVRSAVENQFRKMEQVHDRIRAEELAARLEAQVNN
jgi:hypothetical protein